MRYGCLGEPGGTFFSVLRWILSEKHLTIQTVHFIIYIIIVLLSADSKEQTNGTVRPCNDNGSLP